MRDSIRTSSILGGLCAALLLYAAPAAALMDSGEQSPTLELGTVRVEGQEKIVQTLRAIKTALHTAFSDDPAHADDVVCRINKGMGEAREYLDCATNRDYSQRRDAMKMGMLTGTLGLPVGGDIQMFKALVAAQPNHIIHAHVNGGALQALLKQIPDATEAAPAPATTPGN